MVSVNIMIYFSLFVLCTKKSFQVSITSDQGDKFLRQFIDVRFNDLWFACNFVFVSAHAQSQAERGCNISKAILVENLEETSLKRQQRLLHAYMTSKNVTIYECIIPKELTLFCKSA